MYYEKSYQKMVQERTEAGGLKRDRRNVRLRKREVTWREGRLGCAQVSLVLGDKKGLEGNQGTEREPDGRRPGTSDQRI